MAFAHPEGTIVLVLVFQGLLHLRNTIGKPKENHRKMVLFHGNSWDLPSGNDCYITNWKDPPPCDVHGKINTISMVMFNSYIC